MPVFLKAGKVSTRASAKIVLDSRWLLPEFRRNMATSARHLWRLLAFVLRVSFGGAPVGAAPFGSDGGNGRQRPPESSASGSTEILRDTLSQNARERALADTKVAHAQGGWVVDPIITLIAAWFADHIGLAKNLTVALYGLAGLALFWAICFLLQWVRAPIRQRNEAREIAVIQTELKGIVVQNRNGIMTGLNLSHWLDRGVLAIATQITIINLTDERVELKCWLSIPGNERHRIEPLSEDAIPPDFVPDEKWQEISQWFVNGFWRNRRPRYLSSLVVVPPGMAYRVEGSMLFAIGPDEHDFHREHYNEDLADVVRSHGKIFMNVFRRDGLASPGVEAVHGTAVLITR